MWTDSYCYVSQCGQFFPFSHFRSLFALCSFRWHCHFLGDNICFAIWFCTTKIRLCGLLSCRHNCATLFCLLANCLFAGALAGATTATPVGYRLFDPKNDAAFHKSIGGVLAAFFLGQRLYKMFGTWVAQSHRLHSGMTVVWCVWLWGLVWRNYAFVCTEPSTARVARASCSVL